MRAEDAGDSRAVTSVPACERLWTVHDVSAFLGVPVSTLHSGATTGQACRLAASASTCATTPSWSAAGSSSAARDWRDVRGSIERRGSAWRARYRDPNGRQRSRTFTRKIDAER